MRGTVALALLLAAAVLIAEDRVEKKKRIAKDIAVDEAWVYDDLDQAVAIAKREGKPIFLVFR